MKHIFNIIHIEIGQNTVVPYRTYSVRDNFLFYLAKIGIVANIFSKKIP